MRWYTVAQAAEAIPGVTVHNLHSWDARHAWPPCKRVGKGEYRLYSDATLDLIRTFIKAGKPFHEIRDGSWSPTPVQISRGSPPAFLADYAALDPDWLNALHRLQFGTVARYLASLGRMRPEVRALYRACAREANYQMGGVYTDLLVEYGLHVKPGMLIENHARSQA